MRPRVRRGKRSIVACLDRPVAAAVQRAVTTILVGLALVPGTSVLFGAGPAGAATDPCRVVTPAEVAAALGGPPDAGEADGAGGCTYRARQNPQDQVTIHVDEDPGRDRKGYFERERRRTNVVAVPGVGDGAFAFVSPIGFVQVTVLRGDVLLDVTVSASRVPDRLGAATRLARSASDRLGTSSVAVRTPGLDALAGSWHARAEGGSSGKQVRLWTIRPGGEWTMSAAPEAEAVVIAERGRWHMASAHAGWEGTYTLQGRDAMTTTAGFNARWTRVPDGREPSRVDPALLGIWSSIGLGGNRSPGPLDPALVGRWEASTTSEGLPAELVWRIGAGGLATITVVVSDRGRLDAADGKLTLRPAAGAPETGAYLVLGRDQFETRIGEESFRWQRRGTGSAPR